MAEELNPEISETGELAQKRSAWLVDDSKAMSESVIRSIGMFTHDSLEVTHFQEGINAIREFNRILEENDALPELILMDYTLTAEVPDAAYKTGAEVIQELKRVAQKCNATIPEIIAFSTSSRSKDELLAAGAASAIDKSNFSKIREFFTQRTGQ